MNRRNPPIGTIRRKLRELSQRSSVAETYPETVGFAAVPAAEFDPEVEPDGGVEEGEAEDDTEERKSPVIQTDLGTGDRTLYIDGEAVEMDPDDLEECPEADCQNPVLPLFDACEKHVDPPMPEQDWREGVE